MRYLYLLSCTPEEAGLARAEARALTSPPGGAEASGPATPPRLLVGDVRADIARAAYVKAGAELWASATTLEALVGTIGARGLGAERFRIDVAKLPPKPATPSPEIAGRVACALQGEPDLGAPGDELLVVATEGAWYLGRIFARSDAGYLLHAHRPQAYSSALPTRVARAMVNLVACPGDTIVDPMCGSGTISLEAWSVGVRAVSFDLNPRLARATALNLRHFGYPAWVGAADALSLSGRYDAVVTDPPYGRLSGRPAGLYEGFFAQAATLAPRLCVVTAEDVTTLLERVGFRVSCLARLGERGLVRHVHVALAKAEAPAEERPSAATPAAALPGRPGHEVTPP